MKIRLFLILAALGCSGISGCARVRYMKEISQVSYTEESGTILPERQLYEQLVITKNKVTLSRNGKAANTYVNEGQWEIEVDEAEVRALFEELEAIDFSSIKRVEPEEPEIGGDTKGYSIVYAGDKVLHVGVGGEAAYTDGVLIVNPIKAFIEGLTIPADAAIQYKFPTDQP